MPIITVFEMIEIGETQIFVVYIDDVNQGQFVISKFQTQFETQTCAHLFLHIPNLKN